MLMHPGFESSDAVAQYVNLTSLEVSSDDVMSLYLVHHLLRLVAWEERKLRHRDRQL